MALTYSLTLLTFLAYAFCQPAPRLCPRLAEPRVILGPPFAGARLVAVGPAPYPPPPDQRQQPGPQPRRLRRRPRPLQLGPEGVQRVQGPREAQLVRPHPRLPR